MDVGLRYLLNKVKDGTEIVAITIKDPASIASAEAYGYTWAIKSDAEKHGIPIDPTIKSLHDYTCYDG